MIKRLKQNQVLPHIISIVLLIFFSVILVNYVNLDDLKEKVSLLSDTNSFWGMILFITGVIILYIFLFPSTVLGAASGVIFEFWYGALVYSAACFLASILIFLLVRFLLKDKTQRLIENKQQLKDVQSLAEKEGVRFLFFIRFLPVHATFINSLLAVSIIKPSKFLLSCLFLIPEWIFHVYIGYVASITSHNAIQRGLSFEDYFRITLLIISISAIVYLGWIAQKIIRQSKIKSDNEITPIINAVKEG
jgi:uncharacterized membrane protein YdjX (TVP38/TMEM64 family)